MITAQEIISSIVRNVTRAVRIVAQTDVPIWPVGVVLDSERVAENAKYGALVAIRAAMPGVQITCTLRHGDDVLSIGSAIGRGNEVIIPVALVATTGGQPLTLLIESSVEIDASRIQVSFLKQS